MMCYARFNAHSRWRKLASRRLCSRPSSNTTEWIVNNVKPNAGCNGCGVDGWTTNPDVFIFRERNLMTAGTPSLVFPGMTSVGALFLTELGYRMIPSLDFSADAIDSSTELGYSSTNIKQ